MRLGMVRGTVVLSKAIPELRATRLLLVEPVVAERLGKGREPGGGKTVVVADHLAPAQGQMIAFTEGREAANPYWPKVAPVDAYCSLLVDTFEFEPPRAAQKTEVKR
ncbi:MAG TPA: EutN/CcmL family microcompartment protein [Bryobacteraceae bacterium]|nr:EutN/CcmL family microcompartment protein [Bryobacteraceae bacterium]